MLLLVDSDIRSMRMLEVSLRKAGYDVVMARDGDEALAAMERRVPDLVLSDTRLATPPTVTSPLTPRDAYDLCERLQANEAWARVPFMFLTGSVDLNDKIRGLRLGVEDYLTKPIYLKELLTRVQLVLARRRRESLTSGTTRASFAGELGGMGLIDLLTTVDLGRKTGLLEIDAGAERGTLYFRDGQVIDATTGLLRGERAVYRMLRWNDGSFTARFGAAVLDGLTVEPTIAMGIQGLMLEGLRRADEWNHLESTFAPLDAAWEVDRDALARAGEALDPLAASLAERVEGRRHPRGPPRGVQRRPRPPSPPPRACATRGSSAASGSRRRPPRRPPRRRAPRRRFRLPRPVVLRAGSGRWGHSGPRTRRRDAPHRGASRLGARGERHGWCCWSAGRPVPDPRPPRRPPQSTETAGASRGKAQGKAEQGQAGHGAAFAPSPPLRDPVGHDDP